VPKSSLHHVSARKHNLESARGSRAGEGGSAFVNSSNVTRKPDLAAAKIRTEADGMTQWQISKPHQRMQ
jgi:hypothetical protein